MRPDTSASRPLWPALAALGLLAVAAVLYYRAAWGNVEALVAALDHCKELYCDFTRQYYPTGRDILTTGRPSNGYFYSSFFALLLAPFGALTPEMAVALWTGVQVAGIALLLLPAFDFYRESPVAFVLFAALLALSMPLLHNLKWGQMSTLVTGAALAALFLYRRGHWRSAAVVLAFAVAIKYYVAIIAFYWLLRRDWRFLAVAAAAGLLLWLVLPAAVLGPQGNWAFYVTVRERVAHAVTTWMPEDINAQYLPSVVGRWGERLGGEAAALGSRGVWRVVGYGVFLLNLAAVARVVRRNGPRAAEWAFVLLFLGLPFAIETSWPHYFVYLPFAQTVAWLELRRRGLGGSRAMSTASVLLWLLWGASVVLASMPFFRLVGRWQDYSTYGVLFLANLCLFVVAHYVLLRPARSNDPPVSQMTQIST